MTEQVETTEERRTDQINLSSLAAIEGEVPPRAGGS